MIYQCSFPSKMKNGFTNWYLMTNEYSVGPDLSPNFLQRLSADNKSLLERTVVTIFFLHTPDQPASID